MSDQSNEKEMPQEQTWDESRIVVFLIGICLLIEAGLIYYQAGDNQIVVSSIVGVSGLTLLIFAWLVPLDDEERRDNEEGLIEFVEKPTELILEKKEEETVSVGEQPLVQLVPPKAKKDELKPVAEKTVQPVEELEKAPVTEPVAKPELAEEKVAVEEETPASWFNRLKNGLKKTRDGFVKKIKTLVIGTTKIDEHLLDELECTLFEADIGVKTTKEMLDVLHKRVETEEIKDPQLIYQILKDELKKRLIKFSAKPKMNPNGTTVFLIIGVNGVGKTTTIAKLAHKYVLEKKTVLLAAGDTFRAAAIDQLSIWGERAGAEVIKSKEGGDPGALVFDAIHAAKKRQADLLIVDTAGRMHVKTNLMDELKKIRKIAEKETDGGPHEILLVIDSTTGQNAVQQAKLFNEALPISGLILTKLDGTAKGGVIFSVQENLDVPVKFIGVGEKMGDLLEFDPDRFLEALFDDDGEKSKDSDYKVL